MAWPTSQDFNEAIQNPNTAFGDAALRGGTVAANALGMPIPRSGNYADVYQLTASDGTKWAVKCFTRPTQGNSEQRFTAISEHLKSANLPFTVGFSYLPQGIRVKGKWHPIVKMQWVEGQPLNTFVRDNLGRATILENLLTLWVRMCRRLRETETSHCDLQHGNVLLVPSEGKSNSLGLKLVDYDGMFVPALANQPTGEAGHANFQHPQRVVTAAYSPDLDRFPHLVVATALRALLVGGKALWDKYDTGDNLLFTEKDFQNPANSALLRELWNTGDAFTVGLLAHLAIACGKPIAQTPWLDQLMPGGQPPILTPSQERAAAAALGVPISESKGIASEPPPSQPPAPQGYYYPPPHPRQYPHPGYGYPPAQPGYPHPQPQAYPPGYAPAYPAPQTVPQPAPQPHAFDEPTKRRKKVGIPLGLVVGLSVVALCVVAAGTAYFITKLQESEPIAEVTNSEPLPEIAQETKPESQTEPPTPAPTPITPAPMAPAPPAPMTPPKTDSKPAPQATMPKIVGKSLWTAKIDAPARSLAFSIDSKQLLVSPERTARVKVFTSDLGEMVSEFREHEPPANAFVAPLANGNAISLAREPVAFIWKTSDGKPIGRAPIEMPKVGYTAIRPDAFGQVAALVNDDSADVLEWLSGKVVKSFPVPKQPSALSPIAMAPDGASVLRIDPMYRAHITLLTDGTETTIPNTPPNITNVVSWSPQKKLVAVRVANAEGVEPKITILNTDTGDIRATIPISSIPAAFTPDGEFFVAVGTTHLDVWSMETGRVFGTIPTKLTGSRELTISRDRQYIAVSSLTEIEVIRLDETAIPLVTPSMPDAAMLARLSTQDKPKRNIAPTPDLLAKAEAEMKQGFKDDYARKLPAERKAFAEKLLAQAPDYPNPIGRYWMMNEARAICVETHDWPIVVKAINTMEAAYEVDGGSLKAAAAEKIEAAISNTIQLRTLGESLTAEMEELVAKDDFDRALKLSMIASKCFSRSNATALAKDNDTRAAAIKKHRDLFEPVKASVEKLKEAPNDPAANLALGKFRCFVQQRWDEGFKFLVLGSDETLKKIATLELKAENDTETTDLKRGEYWSDYAKTLPVSEREIAATRAKHWFVKALASARGPADKKLAEDKLAFTLANVEYRPSLLMKLTMLPQTNTAQQQVTKLDATLEVNANEYMTGYKRIGVMWTGLIVPPTAGKYRLIVDCPRAVYSVKLGTKPDERTVLLNTKGKPTKEAEYTFTDKPVAITIEYLSDTMQPSPFKFHWVPPGKTEEAIPTWALFHKKTDEKDLTPDQ